LKKNEKTMKSKSKILLAGADGFIGTTIKEKFKDQWEVNTIGYYSNKANCTFSGDLSKKDFVHHLTEQCEKPEILIFLVGLAHKKGKGAEFDLFKQVNYTTLVNLISGLDRGDKLPEKIIFASTVSVYGERKEVSVYDENTDKRPFSPYAVTKLIAEDYLVENYKEISWVLRFAPVYSKDFMLNIDRRTAIGRQDYKVGNGEQLLSLCNLNNINSSIRGIIDDEVPYGIYNISDETDYSYNSLLELISAEKIIRIPKFIPHLAYYLGVLLKNNFLRENSLKLIKDNVFPSGKIRKYIDLPYNVGDLSS